MAGTKSGKGRGSTFRRQDAGGSVLAPDVGRNMDGYDLPRAAASPIGDAGLVSLGLKRPNILPDRYNGKTPWRDYRQHFEACSLANGWSGSQAKVFLAASLQGAALKVLGNSTGGRSDLTYAELMDKLEKRFGPGRLSEDHLMELRHRRQGTKESLQELGQAIGELSALAYPELSEAGRDRLARGHFSDAVESQFVREGIFRARPTTLEEAVRAALATESFHKIEEQREGKKLKYARVLGGDTESTLEGIKKEIQEAYQRMEDAIHRSAQEKKSWRGEATTDTSRSSNRPRNGGRQAADVVCFRCQQQGHFARNCQQPMAQRRRGSGNEQQPSQGPEGRLEQ